MGSGSSSTANVSAAQTTVAAVAKFKSATRKPASPKPEEPTSVAAGAVDSEVPAETTSTPAPVAVKEPDEVTDVVAIDDQAHSAADDEVTVHNLDADPPAKAPADTKKKKKKKNVQDQQATMEQATEVELLRMVMRRERSGKGNEPDTARMLLHLAARWCDKGLYMEAEPQLERAVGILEATLGPINHETQAAQDSLKAVYRRNGKALKGDDRETTAAMVQMQMEREKQAQRQSAQAASMRAGFDTSMARSLDFDESLLLPQFSDVPVGEGYRDPAWPYETTLRRGGIKLQEMRRVQLVQMLVAKEKCGSQDDVDAARILTNLAARLLKKGKTPEAEQMLIRAVQILVKRLGEEHMETHAARGSLAELYRRNGKANEGSRILYNADVATLTGIS